MFFGFGPFLLVFNVDHGFFCGKVLPVPRRGFLIILGLVANPSGILSAIDFRCNNFVTSVSGRDVGRFGIMVSVSGAVKVRV